jgi:hypothetical protein
MGAPTRPNWEKSQRDLGDEARAVQAELKRDYQARQRTRAFLEGMNAVFADGEQPMSENRASKGPRSP